MSTQNPRESGAPADPHEPLMRASRSGGLPVAPSLGPTLERAGLAQRTRAISSRSWLITALAVALATLAAAVAMVLGRTIDLFTNIAFFQRFSLEPGEAAEHHVGLWVLIIPAIGGLIVGVMARYGSTAIRGHGIPEAMERVLEHDSRIPLRMTFLKPLSAAIAIGTGGPFGAEGPIIATGGALGSMLGQLLPTSASERKALLAAGAAAGMAATFGTPVSAVLLAVELLLFELSPRSLIPVSLAVATATALRVSWLGSAPVFAMPTPVAPHAQAVLAYAILGLAVGVASVGITRLVYAVEEWFEKIPLHYMWWPVFGGLVVGAVGWFEPRVLGVGYRNIEHVISNDLALSALVSLCLCKLIAWSISLGSGTSGGTLAPLFTIGGALGAILGVAATRLFPGLDIDPRIAGVVGMAAMFAGASRALLASTVFAFETTRQIATLLPLLAGCSAAYLISCTLMKHSIMTRKIAQRGVHVPSDYGHDVLDRARTLAHATREVVTLQADQPLHEVHALMLSGAPGSAHQGFPVLDGVGKLLGVVTRRDVLATSSEDTRPLSAIVRRAPLTVFADSPLTEVVQTMLQHDVGRLPVVMRDAPRVVVGMVTRSDVLRAYRKKYAEQETAPGRLRKPLLRSA